MPIFVRMKYSKKQELGENLLYVLIWIMVYLIPILSSLLLAEAYIKMENVFISWVKIVPYFIVFVIHNVLIAPKLLFRHRYISYIAADLALLVIVFGTIELYEGFYFPEESPVIPRKMALSDYAFHLNILLGFFMLGANAAIKLLYQSLRDEQAMEVLKRQNLEAEMNYLKYQINPHFFMNTLNNIHALIDIDTESAKETVIELSKMMRYVLYESGNRLISLRRDIEFLENYIQLMRIRYDSSVNVRIDYPTALPERVAIPPLLMIVFVENAFKHGVSYNYPSFIHIAIDYRAEEETVIGRITNSRHKTENKETGIGLENVRKRLELIYGDRYTLQIDDLNPDFYSVELIIPLLHD